MRRSPPRFAPRTGASRRQTRNGCSLARHRRQPVRPCEELRCSAAFEDPRAHRKGCLGGRNRRPHTSPRQAERTMPAPPSHDSPAVVTMARRCARSGRNEAHQTAPSQIGPTEIRPTRHEAHVAHRLPASPQPPTPSRRIAPCRNSPCPPRFRPRFVAGHPVATAPLPPSHGVRWWWRSSHWSGPSTPPPRLERQPQVRGTPTLSPPSPAAKT